MYQLARYTLLGLIIETSKKLKTNRVYLPALYCKEVTEILEQQDFEILYYDFPYITKEVRKIVIKENAILLTVLYPHPFQAQKNIGLGSYKNEIFDCILINPKYLKNYEKIINNSKSVWSYRKIYGVNYSFIYPKVQEKDPSFKEKLKIFIRYIFCFVRRKIIGYNIEQNLKFFVSKVIKRNNSQKSEGAINLPIRKNNFDLNFIEKYKTHFSQNNRNDEFWFNFEKKDDFDNSSWPGKNNCLQGKALKKYPNAYDINNNFVAKFYLYRDQ